MKKSAEKLAKLDLEKMIKVVFPYRMEYKIIKHKFLIKGICGWPTWFIVIKSAAIDYDYFLTVCEYGDYTRMKKINRDVSDFWEYLNGNGRLNGFLNIIENDNYQGPYDSMGLHDYHRMFKFLKKAGITLFEPGAPEKKEKEVKSA
jgi:hypothetical protein